MSSELSEYGAIRVITLFSSVGWRSIEGQTGMNAPSRVSKIDSRSPETNHSNPPGCIHE